MKCYLILPVLALLLAGSSRAQTSKVYDNLSLHSNILDMDRKYALYLPPDYATSERSYPVLYLLHGGGDDQTGWVQFGEVLHITDRAIREGKATPMIIVMPDADTGRRGYFNSIGDDWRYEDFFFEELMPHVEKTYRIKGEKRYRAVAGLSMGGGGSFMYALHRPELFSSACPLSASARHMTLEAFTERQNSRGNDLAGKSEVEIRTYYERYHVHSLIDNMSADELRSVRWYIDCGDDDFLYEGNSLVHIALRKKEVPHEYRVRDGGHTWSYWRASLPEVLRFVSDAFHQH